jgi:histidine phosphotransferase ChpT
MDELRFAELLASRLCHDLVSPIGAINNGVELLEEFGGGGSDEAMGLIASSGRQAARRLQFYRVAFGLAGSQIVQSVGDVRSLLGGMLEGGKSTLEWDEAAIRAPEIAGWGKLLMNMVALASESLVRGGTMRVTVTINGEQARLSVAANGAGCRLHEDIRQALDPAVPVEALNARGAQPHFTARLASRMGGKLEITEPGPDRMTFSCTLPITGA